MGPLESPFGLELGSCLKANLATCEGVERVQKWEFARLCLETFRCVKNVCFGQEFSSKIKTFGIPVLKLRKS